MSNESERQLILETMETMLKVQLNSVSQLLGREEKETLQPVRRRERKRKYMADLVVEILTSEQRPMHVDELVELLRQRFGRLTDRDSLSSALAKKAKQGLLVRRVTPATFSLRKDD